MRIALSAILLLWMSSMALGCAARKQETLHAMSDEARYLVIGIRSFQGSRFALLEAATALLSSSEILAVVSGASFECRYAHAGEPEFAYTAMAFQSKSSVEQVLGVMHAVEERLRLPALHGLPTLKLDLWWVEGVEFETPKFELPNPGIYSTDWINLLFVEAGEDALIHALDHGAMSRMNGRRIARATARDSIFERQRARAALRPHHPAPDDA